MLSLLYCTGVKAQQYFLLKLELHVLSCVLLRNVQFDFRFFLSFFPFLWPSSRPDVSITKK